MSYITPRSVIAVGSVLPGLAAMAVSLRFYVKLYKAGSVGIDDWLILCSLILTIGLGVMLIVGESHRVNHADVVFEEFLQGHRWPD